MVPGLPRMREKLHSHETKRLSRNITKNWSYRWQNNLSPLQVKKNNPVPCFHAPPSVLSWSAWTCLASTGLSRSQWTNWRSWRRRRVWFALIGSFSAWHVLTLVHYWDRGKYRKLPTLYNFTTAMPFSLTLN